MKSIKWLTASLILPMLMISNLAVAFDFQLTPLPGYTVSKEEHQPYHFLDVYIDKEFKNIYGETWFQKLKGPKSTKEEFWALFEQSYPNLTRTRKSGQSRDYADTNSSNIWVSASFSSNGYQIKGVKKQTYDPLFSLNTGVTPKYGSRVKRTLPENPLINNIEGFAIERPDYKHFDSAELSYRIGRKRHVKTVEGEVWKGKFTAVKKNSFNNRFTLLHNFRDEIEQLGGTVYVYNKQSNLTFEVEINGDTYWGQVHTYNHSMEFKIVRLKPFQQTLFISPDELKTEMDKAGKVTLKGVFFDTNKATIKPESKPALESIIALMQRYPDLVLEVQGHTDSVGSDETNLDLSKRRAASVKQALESAGIPSKNLQSKGFGENSPVATNDTDEGRAQNRRVELHKISGGNEKALLTIDFIKPMPGAVLERTRELKDYDFRYYTKGTSGKAVTTTVAGKGMRADYVIKGSENQRVDDIAREEIVRNYEHVMKLYGATEIFKRKGSLHFKVPDRGDGKELYGHVDAFDGTYKIYFVVP